MKEIIVTLKSGEQITIKAQFSPLGEAGPNTSVKREMATALIFKLINDYVPVEALQVPARLEVGRL